MRSGVPLRSRLVEVIASLQTGELRYGSGCIVAGRTVLTAAHVVAGAQQVSVRGPDKRILLCAPLDPAFVGHPTDIAIGPDLALVEIQDPEVDLPGIGLARLDRDSPEGELVDHCHAWGYPEFAEKPDPHTSGACTRETVDAAGVVPVGSGLVQGLLDLQVTVAPRNLPSELESLGESQWSGMSGGPVTSRGLLLGVVSEHAPRAGTGSITATPLTAINSHPDPGYARWGPGVGDPAAWWTRLGIEGPDALTVLPAPTRRPSPSYRATLHEIGRDLHQRMPRLVGRDADLADVAAFATSDRGYRWLVAGAWTGKSALMYTAVTAGLPDNVDVVTYFLRRIVSDANSSRFVEAVIPQLAYLCDQDAPAVLGPDQFRTLWQMAARLAAERDRHLLLVVDGLDEDLGTGAYGSVASLLPTMAGGHAHVHVTSRQHPELPNDVTAIAGHPLPATQPVELDSLPGLGDQANLARDQLADVLDRRSGDLALETLGLLTAAAGPLAIDDLAQLTAGQGQVSPARRQNIADLLLGDGQLARVVQPTGPPQRPAYQFAHSSLLEQAQAHPNLGDDYYREQLDAWCATWQRQGWPLTSDPRTSTPRYLLDTYPLLLHDERDRASLLCDIGWIDTAIRAIGVYSTIEALRVGLPRESHRIPRDALVVLINQFTNLAPPCPVDRPGYAMSQIRLEALRRGNRELADAAAARLRTTAGSNGSSSSTLLVPVWVSQLQSGRIIGQMPNRIGTAMAYLDDGTVVVAGDSEWVAWDLAEPGAPLNVQHMEGHAGWEFLAGLHGEVYAARSTDVHVWRPRTELPPTIVHSSESPIWGMCRLPDGRIATVERKDEPGHRFASRVRAWDPNGPPNQRAMTLDWPTSFPRFSFVVLSDGSLLDEDLRRWDPSMRTVEPRPLGKHPACSRGDLRSLAALPGGKAVTGGADGGVYVWDGSKLDQQPVRLVSKSRSSSKNHVIVLSDGRVASGSSEGDVEVWGSIDTSARATRLGCHHEAITAMASTTAGRFLTLCEHGQLTEWDADRDRATDPDLDDYLSTLIALPSGDFLVCGYFQSTRVRIDDSGEVLRQAMPDLCFDGYLPAPLLLSDGSILGELDGLAYGELCAVPLQGRWKEPRVVVRYPHIARGVAQLPDGRVITGHGDGRVFAWDLRGDGRDPVQLLEHPPASIEALSVLDAGWVAAIDGRGAVMRWEIGSTDTPEVVGSIQLGPNGAGSRPLCPVGEGRIAVASGLGVLVFDPQRPGEPPVTVLGGSVGAGGRAYVEALPDGRLAAAVDNRLVIWDPENDQIGAEARLGVRGLACGLSHGSSMHLLVSSLEGLAILRISPSRPINARSSTLPTRLLARIRRLPMPGRPRM